MSRCGLAVDDSGSSTNMVIRRSFQPLRGEFMTKTQVWCTTPVGRKVCCSSLKASMLLKFELYDMLLLKSSKSPLSDCSFFGFLVVVGGGSRGRGTDFDDSLDYET